MICELSIAIKKKRPRIYSLSFYFNILIHITHTSIHAAIGGTNQSHGTKSSRNVNIPGRTQEELARRLNVFRQTISKWEKGLSVPDAGLLIRLSEELEVPINKLLGTKINLGKDDTNIEDTSMMAKQLSQINEQIADRTC